jgi:hypothetical protein
MIEEPKRGTLSHLETMSQRFECNPIVGVDYPGGSRPPELYAYPDPSRPIRLLFMGWNPPKPFGGFWSLETEDNLRSNIHEIFTKLGLIQAQQPDGTFLNEFLSKGYFFVHAVKCWSQAKYPGFGRKGNNQERRFLGLPLLHACADTHIRTELERYAPEKVCVLGELPYLALCHVLKDSVLTPTLASPTDGHVFDMGTYRLPWHLLYTVFPQSQTVRIRGKDERVRANDLILRHLSAFL